MTRLTKVEKRTCPKCKREYTEHPALSRDDIKTEIHDVRSQNWVDFAPPKIKPTIKNRRKASMFPSTITTAGSISRTA